MHAMCSQDKAENSTQSTNSKLTIHKPLPHRLLNQHLPAAKAVADSGRGGFEAKIWPQKK